MATTYTPNTGLTPQGQSVNNQQQMVQMSMSAPSSAQVAPEVTNASQQLAEMQTPDQRQNYVNSSQIPAQQANYDELARKLYEYDKMALSPKYNTNPGVASDALSFGRVGASSLQQLTPGTAAGPTTLYADNPKYAATSQAIQQNGILSLMGMLSDSIGKEFTATRGKYASTVSSQEALLKGLLGLLSDATTREEREKDRAEARADRAASRAESSINTSLSLADKLKTDLATGVITWGDAWNTMRRASPKNISDQDIDAMLGGKFDPSDPTGAAGKTTGWAKPGAAQEYASGLRYKQTGQASSDADYQSVISGLDSFLEKRKGTGSGERLEVMGLPISAKGRELETQKQFLSQLMGKLIEQNRMSDSDRTFYLKQMPAWWEDDDRAQAAINGIKEALSAKLGYNGQQNNQNNKSGGSDWVL